jgi:hypothetical protein
MDGQEPNGAAVLDQAVLLNVLSDVRSGDFSVRVPVDTAGLLVVLGEWLPSDAPAGEPPVVLG